ncbi:MAG: ribosome-associated translation inhibitor RaiA [Kiritimatiellales bacterium]
MKVYITGRQVEITDAIRDHIYDKVERTLTAFPRVEDVRIVIELQKLLHRTDVVVTGKDLHVEASSSDENLFKSIDDALIRMERQLRKLREKMISHYK